MKFDQIDIAIIKLLQKNIRLSIATIAQELGLSHNATLSRYNKIQKSKIFKKTYIPIYLPKYVDSKNQTYKMQTLIKAETKEKTNIINFIKAINLELTQIECWNTIGHFNILVWIISENPINQTLIKDKILTQKGIQEIKTNILLNLKDTYTELNLDHLKGKEIYG